MPAALARTLVRRLRRAAISLAIPRERWTALCVRLVDDAEMAELRQKHVGKSGPTDVLAFPSPGMDLDEPEEALGDIVIDVDQARRQAAGPGWPMLADEIGTLAIHGLAHLLGHDHADRKGARTMLRAERRAARSARLPPVRRPYGGAPAAR